MNTEGQYLTTGLNTSENEVPSERRSQQISHGMYAILAGVVQQPISHNDSRKSGMPIIQAQESLVVMRPRSDLHSYVDINRAQSIRSDTTDAHQ